VAWAALSACIAPGAARADVPRPDPDEPRDWTRPFVPIEERSVGLASSHLEVRYARARDPELLSGLSDLVAFGLSARAMYGERLGYAAGAAFELGVAAPAGFVSAFELYPAGAALAIGPTGYLGAFLGVSANGVSARVPYTVTLPAELRLELDVTRRARLGALVAIAWAPAEEARRGGSQLVPFADETTAAITARFGKTFPRDGNNLGRGYFFRVERREQMGTVLLGGAFGVEIDFAR
jgi:hypothetical protein